MQDSTPDYGNGHKWTWRAITVLFAMMTLLMGLMLYAIVSSNEAAAEAVEASTDAVGVQASLKIHEAKQNGSFESIESQLGTLRTYHSTLRGDMKELRDELKEQRDLLIQGLPTHPDSTE